MTIKEIRERADKILADASAKKLNIEKKIEAAGSMEKKATDTMTEAYASTNVKAYHKAQDEIRESKDAIAMYSEQIKELDREPLISEEEYEELSAAIMDELRTATEQAKDKLISLIEQMIPVREELNKIVKDGNDLLYTLQVELYRDRKYLDQTIEALQYDRLRKYQDHLSVGSTVNYITNCWIYKDRKEEEHDT